MSDTPIQLLEEIDGILMTLQVARGSDLVTLKKAHELIDRTVKLLLGQEIAGDFLRVKASHRGRVLARHANGQRGTCGVYDGDAVTHPFYIQYFVPPSEVSAGVAAEGTWEWEATQPRAGFKTISSAMSQLKTALLATRLQVGSSHRTSDQANYRIKDVTIDAVAWDGVSKPMDISAAPTYRKHEYLRVLEEAGWAVSAHPVSPPRYEAVVSHGWEGRSHEVKLTSSDKPTLESLVAILLATQKHHPLFDLKLTNPVKEVS